MDMSQTVTTGNTINRSNRNALLLTAAIFIVPVIVAYTLLKTGWYAAAGTSNRGALIDPPIEFDQLALRDLQQQLIPAEQFRKKWWIMYVVPEVCDSACKNSLYLMRQTHQALGPEQPRVAELIVMPQQVDAALAQWLTKEFPTALQTTADAALVNQVLQPVLASNDAPSRAGHLYLVDTMGAIFMHYPSYADEQESILKGRNLLKDLQRVLKLSKIG
jgi:hypothetical protein